MTLPVYPDPDAVAAVAMLTPRERDALVLTGKGLRAADIAARMFIGRATLDNKMSAARKKLGAATNCEAAVIAAKAGIV